MNRSLILAGAVTALTVGIAAPASAETLAVQGVVAPYCNVNLTNVSSGTASIAMANVQTVANLRLSCNAVTGTKFVLQVANGDLVQQVGSIKYRINYDLLLDSPSDSNFAIAAHDTFPTSGVENSDKFTRQNTGYTQPIANGIPLVLSLNMNVAADPNNTSTSQNYSANAAPAGTYSETFTFTATSV